MIGNQLDRYLALLGLEREPPSLAALTRIATAHLGRLPFENVSKLVRISRGFPHTLAPWIPDMKEFLDASEREGTGGTCYRLNTALHELLWALDYVADQVAADMDRPDVHVALVVHLDGWRYLVDVGFAAPFLEPLSLDQEAPVRVPHGREEYVLHPTDRATGIARLEHRRDGVAVHGYTVKPEPWIARRKTAILRDSFRPDSPFLNRLRIVRHVPGRSVSLRNFTVEVIAGGILSTIELNGRADLVDFVVAEFGIAHAAVVEACDVLVAQGHGEFA